MFMFLLFNKSIDLSLRQVCKFKVYLTRSLCVYLFNFQGCNKNNNPPPHGAVSEGFMDYDWFLPQYSSSKAFVLLFHNKNGQNEYILIIFSFTNIVTIALI